MQDLRQTSEYAKYMEHIGWTVEKPGNFFIYIKKFPLIGSFIKIQRPEKIDAKLMWNYIKKHRSFQIVVEPKYTHQFRELVKHGFKPMKSYFVPSKTIQIDLKMSESKLLKEMHSKTRYNVKLGTKNHELRVTNSNDIESFASFWQKCALKQRGMFLSQVREIIEIHKAFGKNSHIIQIMREKEVLAAILLICTKDIAYYMYAASTTEGKKLFAPTQVAWEAIKLSRKLKKKVFDFEGIYDDRFPIKSWHGFTRFKKSFGGREVIYPGSFTKYRLPV